MSLLEALASWREHRVLVVGDFMLDQLVFGDAERLTADAPVPVLAVQRTEHRPGGAANVCNALVALGASVEAFGITGDDPEGRTLREELQRAGVDTDSLLPDPDRPTTVKRNLIGLAQHRHPQKMFRLDYEATHPLPDPLRDALLDRLARRIPHADVVALEDYNKGVCDPEFCARLIALCRDAGKELIVDPAAIDDFTRYRGATAITPNRSEAERATLLATDQQSGALANAPLARKLQDDCDLDAVVLTLDRHGALLLQRDAEPLHVPTRARTVYDVTGAGDMVLAALASARANRLDWPDATALANTAAGLEVEVFGVQPIPFERLYAAAIAEARHVQGKHRTLDEAYVEVRAARREGRRVVFTNGCFDILHAGHIRLLRRARELGDLLVVAINSDDSVRRLKGEDRPVHNAADRASILGELRSVDIVVVFDEDTPENALQRLQPDVLVKGGDYTRDRVVGADMVESWGGAVEIVDTLEGRSTSAAIARIRAT